jgi:methyl-accepting chemotaxis protein
MSRIKINILPKTIIFVVVISATCLVTLIVISFWQLDVMENTAVEKITEMQKDVVKNTTDALNELGKTAIKNQAISVAETIGLYLKTHPYMTLKALEKDPEFQKIAVQPVGKTGYTAVADYHTFINIAHKDPNIVNLDLSTLAEKLPGFWAIMSATGNGQPSEGFYDWIDPDGSVRSKYMYIAIIDGETADGAMLNVAATTYISEFNQPAELIEDKFAASRNSIVSDIGNAKRQLLNNATIFSAAIVLFVIFLSIIFTRSITTPLRKLTLVGEKIAKGDLETAFPEIKTNDEVTVLANSLEVMRKEIKLSKENLEKSIKDLEISRDSLEKSKKELEQKNEQLEKVNEELKETNKLMVGRELKMAEMKKEVEELKKKPDQT